MVRAKFWVTEVTLTQDGATVQMHPVTDGSLENDEFYKWTPGGSLTLSLVSLETAKFFKPGSAYYLDLTAIETPHD